MLQLSNLDEVVNTGVTYKNARELWDENREAKTAQVFKDSLLNLAQVYYSGMIYSCGTATEVPKKLAAWNDLWHATEKVSHCYYSQEPLDRELVRNALKRHRSVYIHTAGERQSNVRHLEGKGQQVLEAVVEVLPAIQSMGLDILMPVMSGGMEPAALLNSQAPFREVIPGRLSKCKASDMTLKIPEAFSGCYRKIAGKNVLLVEDVIITGYSATMAAETLRQDHASKIFMTYIINEGDKRNPLEDWKQIDKRLYELR